MTANIDICFENEYIRLNFYEGKNRKFTESGKKF